MMARVKCMMVLGLVALMMAGGSMAAVADDAGAWARHYCVGCDD